MPKLSVWTIRVALLQLVVGFTFGALMLAEKGVSFVPGIFAFLPLHIHTLLFGWTVQLIYGVAYFILPKFGSKRGNRPLIVTAIILVNAGVVAGSLSRVWEVMSLVASGLYLLSAVAFVAHAWPRVKAFGK